jgi:hypothetical protein
MARNVRTAACFSVHRTRNLQFQHGVNLSRGTRVENRVPPKPLPVGRACGLHISGARQGHLAARRCVPAGQPASVETDASGAGANSSL